MSAGTGLGIYSILQLIPDYFSN